MNPTGSVADFIARLRAVLPRHWFADDTPLLDGLLTGLAAGWAWLYAALGYVRLQTRLATLGGVFLDIAAGDYLGARIARRAAEPDTPFRARIERELLRERGTRPALTAALVDLTGRAPTIFEPARPLDTGAWNGAAGYGAAGGWGSLALPFQCFVTAYRPLTAGLGVAGGYGSGAGGYGRGALQYAGADMIEVSVTDADILAAIAGVMPVAAIAWTRIAG